MPVLDVLEIGRGPAVLLLHGSPSPSTALLPLARVLSRTHRVLVPDLPGYGGSPAVASYALDAINERLEHAVRARALDAVAIVGFSAGGYRALSLAVRATLRITAVVTLGGFAALTDGARDGLRGAAAAVLADPQAARRGPLLETLPARLLSPAFAAAHPRRAVDVTRWLDLAPAGVLADELVALADAPDLRPALAGVRAPITAIVGARDEATPTACSEDICAAARDGHLEVIPDAGHVLFWEAPAATCAAVQRGLARGA